MVMSFAKLMTAGAVLARFAAADFSIWESFEYEFESVDGHGGQSTSPSGILAAAYRSNWGGGDCNDNPIAQPDQGDGGGQFKFGCGQELFWAGGFCGLNQDYKCDCNDQGQVICQDLNGGNVATCTAVGKAAGGAPDDVGACTSSPGFGDTYYDAIYDCVGPVNC